MEDVGLSMAACDSTLQIGVRFYFEDSEQNFQQFSFFFIIETQTLYPCPSGYKDIMNQSRLSHTQTGGFIWVQGYNESVETVSYRDRRVRLGMRIW